MKITKYIVMLAAAVGMTAACQKEEFVTFNPEDVVAPVLHAVEDIVVTVDNKSEAVTFTWDAADFGVKTQVYYSLDMAKDGKTVNLFSGVSGTSMNVSLENINNKAFNDLEIPSGEAGDVTFNLSAKLNVGASYAAAPVAAKVTPTAAEKVYPNVWVIGNYCGWAHDKSLYLWNYAEDGDVFMGVVDFGAGDEKTGGFKITPEANWNSEFGGTGTADVDPASIPVVTSGGSDIKNFTTMRFYHFSLSTTALTLSKNYAFNQVGIIGLNGDWENDIVMEYSSNKQRFYADIDVAAATEMKFRMDADWAVNFGGDIKALSNGGDNIPVEPGQYRVYLDMNNLGAITCTFDEKMYGQEENVGGSEPENPDPVVENVGWGIVGTINEWGGAGADIDMKVGAGWLVATGVELPEGSEIKFRLDGGWDVNFGGTFAVDTEIALVAGGDNFFPTAGTYDIYLNPDIPAAYFMTAGADAPAVPQTWGIVGTTNNWGGDDLDMGMKLDEEGKYWVRKAVALPDGGEIKFRFAHDWGVNFGGAFSVDSVIELAAGGDNLKTVAGTYDIYLDVEGAKAYIMTEGKTPADAGAAVVTYIDASAVVVGLSGSFAGVDKWIDPADDRLAVFASKDVTDEATYAGTYTYEVASIAIAESDQFKLRINGDWIGVAGATVEGLAVTGEDNFIAGEAGTYKVTITFAWDGLKPSDVKAVFAK